MISVSAVMFCWFLRCEVGYPHRNIIASSSQRPPTKKIIIRPLSPTVAYVSLISRLSWSKHPKALFLAFPLPMYFWGCWRSMKRGVNSVIPNENLQTFTANWVLGVQCAGWLSSLRACKQPRPVLRRRFKNPPPLHQPQNPIKHAMTPTKKGQGKRGSYGWLNGEVSLPNIFDCSLNWSQAVSQFVFCWAAKPEVFDITQICHPNRKKKKVLLFYTHLTLAETKLLAWVTEVS